MIHSDYIDAEQLDDFIEELEDDGIDHTIVAKWKEFRDDLEGYCADWRWGDVAVHEHHIHDYLRDMIEDVYEMPNTWPYVHLDWDSIIREALFDYTALVSPDGDTYWVR